MYVKLLLNVQIFQGANKWQKHMSSGSQPKCRGHWRLGWYTVYKAHWSMVASQNVAFPGIPKLKAPRTPASRMVHRVHNPLMFGGQPKRLLPRRPQTQNTEDPGVPILVDLISSKPYLLPHLSLTFFLFLNSRHPAAAAVVPTLHHLLTPVMSLPIPPPP